MLVPEYRPRSPEGDWKGVPKRPFLHNKKKVSVITESQNEKEQHIGDMSAVIDTHRPSEVGM
jgi:hypothetical protein